jgi:aryl-alcohol dehydrogenase-like predicted oxidoreductase
MKYRTLGNTRLRVSVIGLGTWQFGGEWGRDYTQAEADAVVAQARASGISLIDTAECYGDHLSERLVGGAIRQDRDRWVLATKFGHRFTGFLEREQLWSPDAVLRQLEDSLRALGTDHIDLYQFHSGDDAAFGQDALWEMLRRQVELGKIRHLGISVTGGKVDTLGQTKAAPRVGAGAIQVVYNRLAREPEEALLPACREIGLGVLARVPLASGFLSGKYHPGARFTGHDVRASRDSESLDATLREVEEIARREVPAGVPMAQWALAWCLRHPAVSCVIPGCKDPEQVIANAAAADLVAEDHPLACA